MPQKKHALNYFALEMAAIVFSRRRHRREQRARREDFLLIHLFWMLEKHENIVCQAMLFLISFRQ